MQLPPGATLQLLSDADRKKLRLQQQNGAMGCVVLFGLLFIVGGIASAASSAGPAGLVPLVLAVPLGILAIYSGIRSGQLLAKDIKEDKKIILRSILEAKTEHRTRRRLTYYLHLSGKQFPADVTTYVRSETGQLVEVHYTPYAGNVLSINLDPETSST
jgi:hypothetical protein